MRSSLLLLCLLPFYALADVTPPVAPVREPAAVEADLSGIYEVSGVADDDAKYTGVAIFRKLGPTVYAGQWISGGQYSAGIGLRSLHEGTLSFSWQVPGKGHGITVYRVQGDTLEGRWSSGPAAHTETLKLLKRQP